ncbi:hypothetical protein, partial [Pseudomonas viridiflava]|uniref:hypothetical protein n=1 Tax=Pseudomonas viridiflava TaxID=33069 RepID=UPI0019D29D1B
LVQSGFERLETKDLILTQSDEDPTTDLFTPRTDLIIPQPDIDESVVLPDSEAVAALPKALREKIEVSPETGTLTVKGGASASQLKQIAETFKQPEIAKTVRERLDSQMAARNAPSVRERTPAEKGESSRVPLLGITQHGFFDVFDDTPLLDADWEIDEFDPALSESDFSHDMEAMRRASLSISKLEKIKCDVYDKLDSQLALFGQELGWQTTDLIYWLDRNLYSPYSEGGNKAAWLDAAVTHLIESRGFTLDELAYRKFRLRG